MLTRSASSKRWELDYENNDLVHQRIDLRGVYGVNYSADAMVTRERMEMGDVGDDFRAYREYKRERKEKQLENLPAWYERLHKAGFCLEHLNGEHVRLSRYGNDIADWWPSTGTWILKANKKRGVGVARLIEATKEKTNA